MQGLEKQIEREKSEKKRKKREWWEHHFYHGVVRCGHFQRTGGSLYNFKFVCWIGDWFSSFLSCYSQEMNSLLHMKQETLGKWRCAMIIMLISWELLIYVLG